MATLMESLSKQYLNQPVQVQAAQVSGTPAESLIDINSFTEQFAKAADLIKEQYPGALESFQKYVSEGQKANLNYQEQAMLSVLPLSESARSALGEYRQMLGLKDIPATAGLSYKVGELLNRLPANANTVDVRNKLQNIQSQLQQAGDLEDPQQRNAMREQLTSQLSEISNNQDLGLDESMQTDLTNTLSQVSNHMTNNYKDQGAQALSGSDIQSRLEALPGYQFQMDQGMKAIERSAASKGGLLSGGAAAELQNFGQGLASSYYGDYMNQLKGLIEQQSPAMQQQAALLQSMGAGQAQTGLLQGQAALQSGQDIAQAGAQAQYADAAATQAGQQAQAGLLQGRNLANASMAQQANMMNAQLQSEYNAKQEGLLAQYLKDINKPEMSPVAGPSMAERAGGTLSDVMGGLQQRYAQAVNKGGGIDPITGKKLY